MKFANYAFKSAPISDPSLMSLSEAAAAARSECDLCKSCCCIFCQMLNTECTRLANAAAAPLITETREGEELLHQVQYCNSNILVSPPEQWIVKLYGKDCLNVRWSSPY